MTTINIKCSICDIKFDNVKQLNKHLRTTEHEGEKVKKGIYKFGACPYCRLHCYLIQLPEHIKHHHKELYDKWAYIMVLPDIEKIITINTKLKELKELNDPIKELKEPIKEPIKEQRIIKRRGKYRHMTEEQIKIHKKELCKERMRRFYEKNINKYKTINASNYEKRTKKNINVKKGRPPIYTN